MAHPKTKAGEARLNILIEARAQYLPDSPDEPYPQRDSAPLKEAILEFRQAILDEAALERAELYDAMWVWADLHRSLGYHCFLCYHGVDHNPMRYLTNLMDMYIDLEDSND